MDPFESLTDQQREIVFKKEGKLVVRACPGSGKTYSVAARFAHLINEWEYSYQGIAALSFTNVAWQEIENYLQDHFNIYTPIRHPHFLGTLDSFINQYIFLPFGHLVLECESRPTLVGEPHGTWSSGHYKRDYKKYFDKTSLDINGELIPTVADLQSFHFSWKRNKNGSVNGHVKNVLKVKQKYWREGYATQDDANYFALKLLEKYTKLSKSLSVKFPTLIIDESQDTNIIQMEIINHLIDQELKEVMFVGDPDQAIFEWNEARPDLFESKYEEWEENSIRLGENRRSSQNICDFTFNLSSLAEPALSINPEVKDLDHEPKILIYDKNNIKVTIEHFINNCRKVGININKDNIAILCRSQSFMNKILGIKNYQGREIPWKTGKLFVKQFALGKYLIDNKSINKGYKLIEKAVYNGLHETNYCKKRSLDKYIQENGFISFRTKIDQLINLLPKTNDINLDQWINTSNLSFKEHEVPIKLEIDEQKGKINFDNLFKTARDNKLDLEYRLGTVHSVKGETFEAVLLFLKKKGIGRYYKTMLKKGAETSDEEELRIVYVAMTRPRRLLTIAVPDKENLTAWKECLTNNDTLQ
jgi:superfamily I DNA/RNA helicase